VNDRFQQAQRKLNLVKKHAHEIVGVKREQVAMVVENFSRPGTYDITVHQDGRVIVHQWTAPPPENLVWTAPVEPTTPEPEEPQQVSEPVISEQLSVVAKDDVVSPEPTPVPVPFDEPVTVDPFEVTEEEVLGEAQEEVPPAPEPVAATTAAAPRRRGRPKKP
jgi:hypothetical protein